MKNKIIGFIVIGGSYGAVLQLITPLHGPSYSDFPRAGVLMWGDRATLFSSQKRARAAIERSKVYSKGKGYSWDTGAFGVVSVEAQ